MNRGNTWVLVLSLTGGCAFDADFDTRLQTPGEQPSRLSVLRCKGGAPMQGTCAERAARASGSADYCAAAPVDEQLRCLEAAARTSRNAAFCVQLTPGRERENCIAGIVREAQNPELCKQLSGLDRDYCLDFASEHLQLAEPCSEIEGAAVRAKCLDRAARKAEDPALCQQIESEALRTTCEKDLKKLTQNEFQMCWAKHASAGPCVDLITHPSAHDCARTGNRCAAVTELDPSICLSLDVHRASCSIAFATARNDPSFCAELPSEDERDECYLATSEQLLSSATCLKVSAGRRARCAKALYSRSGEPRLCAALASAERAICERSVSGG